MYVLQVEMGECALGKIVEYTKSFMGIVTLGG